MSAYSFKLFGSYLIQDGAGNTVHFRTDKERALLAYLLVESDRAHHREQLMDLLWPGLPERSARSALRQVLSLLRKDIPPLEPGAETLLQTHGQMVQIHADFPYIADVTLFRQAMTTAQTQRGHDWLLDEAYKQSLQQAVACYEGPFLLDYTVDDSSIFEEWAQIQRESFRHQLLDGLHQLATIDLHQGLYVTAEAYARRQIEIDNLSEIAYQQLMEILARAGQAAQAVIVYEKLSRLLRAE